MAFQLNNMHPENVLLGEKPNSRRTHNGKNHGVSDAHVFLLTHIEMSYAKMAREPFSTNGLNALHSMKNYDASVNGLHL